MTASLELTPALVEEITHIVFGAPAIDPPPPCDVIFVFGGSHPGLWEKTAEAFHQGLGREVVVTGGHKPGVQPHRTWADGATPEAHVIRRELLRLGVPEQRIYFEDRSTNTLENVLFACQVYDFTSVKRILAVCKCYGVGRQCRTLEQHLPPRIKVIPFPFDTTLGRDGPFTTRETWMQNEASRVSILDQVRKIVQYGRQGHLRPLERLSPALAAIIQL
jgi:uncharacterized SAM-binding protein YcdF (DUF218 family)